MRGDNLSDPGKEAFRLFEEGKYRESYELCIKTPSEDDDSRAILTGMNLFYLERLDEAEAYFKDLLRKMPDSSYVHSYLGRILEKKEDETAVTEYARAVSLDPSNQEALRNYAAYLVSREDFRMAVPVQRRLLEISHRDDDARSLARSLARAGMPADALALFGTAIRRCDNDKDYVELLLHCCRLREAADESARAFSATRDPEFARIHLSALSRISPEAAPDEYLHYYRETGDPGFRYEQAALLLSLGRIDEADEVCRDLLKEGSLSEDPRLLLLNCDLLAGKGMKDSALSAYELLLRTELATMHHTEVLSTILSHYREFLQIHLPIRDLIPRYLALVSSQPHVICLVSTGRLYEDLGDLREARSWYYRAYRTDFLTGGIEYARFLQRHDEPRECEKAMLYMVNNVRKTGDLVLLASMVADESGKLYRMRRLLARIIQRLDERMPMLTSDGLEFLALFFLVSGSHALEDQDYPKCKEYCMRGLDVVPFHSTHLKYEDFLRLLRACKERVLYDIPLMGGAAPASFAKAPRVQDSSGFLDGLDPTERRAVEFIRVHQQANEMELRKVLGTRRVVGIINRIIQKTAAKGVRIIEKKGVGDEGEIYEYVRA